MVHQSYLSESLQASATMDTVTENEKKPLIEKGPVIRLRPVATADTPTIHTMIRDTIERPFNNSSLDTVPSLSRIENGIQSIEKARAHLYYVALDIASGTILGFAMPQPFFGKPAGLRSCFDRTATLRMVTAGEQVIGPELQQQVVSALADQKTVSEVENRVLLSRGFKLSGTLKEVAEKDGTLLDQVLLHYRL